MEYPLWLLLTMLISGLLIPVMVLRWRMRQRVMQALLQEAHWRIAEQLLRELQQPGFVQAGVSVSVKKDS